MSKYVTYDDLMQAYEKACAMYYVTKLGTKAHEMAGKRMDKAAQALETFRANEKRNNGESLSVYESLSL
jgi:mannose/cellobiose epimerase-like protein (N-acyl-D-glucosamine 2-epimerase family)